MRPKGVRYSTASRSTGGNSNGSGTHSFVSSAWTPVVGEVGSVSLGDAGVDSTLVSGNPWVESPAAVSVAGYASETEAPGEPHAARRRQRHTSGVRRPMESYRSGPIADESCARGWDPVISGDRRENWP